MLKTSQACLVFDKQQDLQHYGRDDMSCNVPIAMQYHCLYLLGSGNINIYTVRVTLQASDALAIDAKVTTASLLALATCYCSLDQLVVRRSCCKLDALYTRTNKFLFTAVFKIRGPSKSPKNGRALIVRSTDRGPLIFGSPHVIWIIYRTGTQVFQQPHTVTLHGS